MIPARHPIEGEILAPGDGARVIVRPSVLREGRIEVVAPAGFSIDEIVEAHARPLAPRARWRVFVSGEPVPAEWWDRVRVKRGATVAIVGVPAKKAIAPILTIVVAVAAIVLAPIIAAPLIGALGITAGSIAATAITGLVGAGLAMAGSLALNALFPTAKPQLEQLSGTRDSLERSPTFSIGGGRNEARPYATIASVLGRHRMSPPLGAQPFTEFAGDDQFLRMLFVWGYGPISVSDLKIGETPVSQFEGVQVETVQMLANGGQVSLYPAITFEEQVQVALTDTGAWTSRTTAEDIDEFSVDVQFPNGVYILRQTNGKRELYTVTIAVEYRATGGSTWSPAGEIRVVTSSADTIRRTLRVVTPSRGQYDVRLSRSSPLAANDPGDDPVSEAATWTAIRSRKNEAPLTPDKPLTVTALRIKASEELSGVVQTLNGVCQGLVTAWNGSSWVAQQASSNPADIFRHVLQGAANARPVTDAEIDLAGLQDWHAYCAAQGFTFDQVRDFSASVFDTLRDVAAAGRAAVSLKDGKWGVIYDGGATDIVQHFTPRNSSGFSGVRGFVEMPHAWRVRFVNAAEGWLQDERLVYDDGYDATNATKFEGIDFPGVTSADLVWRHGRYHIAQLRLRRETYELDTDFEHLVATRGDRVHVQHDVTLWGLSAGRVKAVSGQDVTLDEPLTMESGTTYTLRFRLADGSTLERTVTGADGTFATVTLAGSGDVPAVGDMFMAGEEGLESVVLRVLAVTPRQDFGARLLLVDDAPEIAQADQGAVPPFRTGIANQIDFRTLTVAPVSAVETLVEGVDGVRSRVRVTWAAPSRGEVATYRVRHRPTGADGWSSLNVAGAVTHVDLFDLAAGAHEIEVKALFTNGTSTQWAATSVVVEAAFAPPSNVTGFRIAINGDTATLAWDTLPELLVAGYEIRFSPIAEGEVAWFAAAPLITTGQMGTVQVAARVGTYLIKAVTFAGTESLAATRIVNTVGPLTAFNAVETLTEHPTWSGEKTSLGVDDSGALRLVSAEDIFALDDVFSPGDVFYLNQGLETSGVYLLSDVIDLGAVYTSLVSVALDAAGENMLDDIFARADVFEAVDIFGVEPSQWAAAVDVATTDEDPAADNWSAWVQIGAANLTARAFKFRLRLDTFDSAIAPVARALTVTVDMPDRVDAGDDIAVPTDGLTVTFAPAFRRLQGLGIAAQGLATGDYYEITSKSETGFSIIFRDAGGSPVARTFDYVAKGYGRVTA